MSPLRRGVTVHGLHRLRVLVLLLVLAWSTGARANDFDQFQNARFAYDSLNYELAADLFRGLLANALPTDNRPLVLESRKYLGAALLFLGHEQEAAAQFETLLRAEPEYVLDPLTFPEEVNKHFDAVRTRLERERAADAEAKARAAASQQQEQKTDLTGQRQEKLDRLIQLATTERVEVHRSRWLALIPFGVGQFQNDHDNLGLLLAVSEGVLLSAVIGSYLLHENLRDQPHPTDEVRDDARLAETVFRYGNRISFGLFSAVAVAGIIDAQIRFKPIRTEIRHRPLPDDLKRLKLSVAPGAISLTGRF